MGRLLPPRALFAIGLLVFLSSADITSCGSLRSAMAASAGAATRPLRLRGGGSANPFERALEGMKDTVWDDMLRERGETSGEGDLEDPQFYQRLASFDPKLFNLTFAEEEDLRHIRTEYFPTSNHSASSPASGTSWNATSWVGDVRVPQDCADLGAALLGVKLGSRVLLDQGVWRLKEDGELMLGQGGKEGEQLQQGAGSGKEWSWCGLQVEGKGADGTELNGNWMMQDEKRNVENSFRSLKFNHSDALEKKAKTLSHANNFCLDISSGSWSFEECQIRAYKSTCVRGSSLSSLRLRRCLLGGEDPDVAFCNESSSVMMKSVNDIRRRAENGIFLDDMATAYITDCEISFTGSYYGSAILCKKNASLLAFSSNFSRNPTGVVMHDACSAFMANCSFKDNDFAFWVWLEILGDGADIYAPAPESKLVLRGTRVEGEIWVDGSRPKLVDVDNLNIGNVLMVPSNSSSEGKAPEEPTLCYKEDDRAEVEDESEDKKIAELLKDAENLGMQGYNPEDFKKHLQNNPSLRNQIDHEEEEKRHPFLPAAPLNNRYFAMRHGKSEANQQGLIVSDPRNGVTKFGLTEEGRQQARASAIDFLRRAADGEVSPPVLILSSDFRRTVETAQELKLTLNNNRTDLHVCTELRERFFGSLELGDHGRYSQVWEMDALDGDHHSMNCESAIEVRNRIMGLIEKTEREHKGKIVFLVSHGDALQITQTAFAGLSVRGHRSLPHLHPAEIRELQPRLRRQG